MWNVQRLSVLFPCIEISMIIKHPYQTSTITFETLWIVNSTQRKRQATSCDISRGYICTCSWRFNPDKRSTRGYTCDQAPSLPRGHDCHPPSYQKRKRPSLFTSFSQFHSDYPATSNCVKTFGKGHHPMVEQAPRFPDEWEKGYGMGRGGGWVMSTVMFIYEACDLEWLLKGQLTTPWCDKQRWLITYITATPLWILNVPSKRVICCFE